MRLLRAGLLRGAAGLLAAAGVAISTPLTTASAAGLYPPAWSGYDISWPQCGAPYPSLGPGWFGVVGVNDGRPQTTNPCFGSELAWAQSQDPSYAAIYLNVAYGTSLDGPQICDATDKTCQAYNYGWMSAQYAYVHALADSDGASEQVTSWWLDVEVDNDWSSDAELNSHVIQGTLDYLQQVQGISAGVYSVSDMWHQIAGGYAPPAVPNWVAGGSDANDFGTCKLPIWPGGQISIFQSLTPDGRFDVDRGC